jgi:peroxiredoxin
MRYRAKVGVSFPLVYDKRSVVWRQYQVGESYGNKPPTYIIIDKKRVVSYRTDDTFDQTERMIQIIQELIKN